MFDSIIELANQFNTFAKSNPVVAGAVSLYGLGIVTFFSRNLPRKIWDFTKKQTTISLTLNNCNEVFFYFLEWFEEQNFYKNVRTLKAQTKRDSWRGDTICGAGFGNHFFIYKGRPYMFQRLEKDANNTTYTKETIQITTIGRSNLPILSLLEDIEPILDKKKETKLYKWREKMWDYSHTQASRTLESVVLPKNIKNKLINTIKEFDESEDWYLSNGVPYRLGILFKGPPGTGKTSLVKAICSYLEKDLYIMNLANMDDKDIDRALSTVPKNCVVLAEDIDTVSVTKTRKRKNIKRERAEKYKIQNAESVTTSPALTVSEGDIDTGSDFTWMTLTGLLNAIDGVSGSDGRLLIFTTNYPEKLDDALLRPGRIDLQLDITFMTEESIKDFFNRFYPDFKFPKNLDFKEKLTPATLQQHVLEYKKDPEKVLEKIVTKTQSYREHMNA
jgi:chaperone BCS1